MEQELLSLGLDEEVLNVARKVLREGDVWDRLEENGVRLGVLQKAQWDRLKRGSAETGQVEATAGQFFPNSFQSPSFTLIKGTNKQRKNS